MAYSSGNYTSTQIQQMGLDPNNTTETQQGMYRLSNDGRGGRNLEVVGGGGSGGSSGGGFDYTSALKNALQMTIDANKPAISSLQASIPEQSAKFAQQRTQLQGEVAPLQSRYDNLINSLKNNQSIAENRQTQVTAGELAKRGITNDSTLFGQELTNAVNPITQQYTGQINDTGMAEQADIRDINNNIANTYTNETDATRAIQNAIAQLMSGNPNVAVQAANAGQSNYQFGQNLSLQEQQLAQQKAQQEATNNLAAQQLAATIAQQKIADAISQGQLGVSQGNLALNQSQFDFQKQLNNPNDPTYGANTYLQRYLNNQNMGNLGPSDLSKYIIK